MLASFSPKTLGHWNTLGRVMEGKGRCMCRMGGGDVEIGERLQCKLGGGGGVGGGGGGLGA